MNNQHDNQRKQPSPTVASMALRAAGAAPYGVAYVLQTMTVLAMLLALAWLALSLVNNWGFVVAAFPVSILLVAVPIFCGLTLYLARSGRAEAGALQWAARRRSVQLLQVVSFLVCFVTLVVGAYILFLGGAQYIDNHVEQTLGSVACILSVFGSSFSYYWFAERRLG